MLVSTKPERKRYTKEPVLLNLDKNEPSFQDWSIFSKIFFEKFSFIFSFKSVEALRILGHNVMDCQESVYRHWPQWERFWNGEPAGKIYREIFRPNNSHGYTACCDTPCNVLWESLSEEFPDAKGEKVISII